MGKIEIFYWVMLILGLLIVLGSPDLGLFASTIILLIYLKKRFKEIEKGLNSKKY